MANLTYAQLKALWLANAAGTQYATNAYATLMAAIAEAESGGNPAALNPNDNNGTQSSYGLWQVSTGTHVPPSANWADPNTNAQLALGKLESQGLTAWGTYDSGAYAPFMSSATTPDSTGLSTTATLLSSTTASGGTAACALSVPVAGCILPKSSLRGMIGGLCLAAAGIIGLAAAVILAASAFERSGAARAVGQAVPPVRAVVNGARRLAPGS